jgi:Skp family chaperone for outer membrane proteins
MKGSRVFIKSLVFVLILAASAFAQTETTQNAVSTKVGVIDTSVFYDKEKGIREIVAAQEKLDAELKPKKDELAALQEIIQKLEKEINEILIIEKKYAQMNCFSPLVKMAEKYEKLVSEYKQKETEAKNLYEQRKAEIFADVYKRVGDAITQFAKEKGYVIILDKSKDNSSVIIEGETFDVTEDFIKYYNENYNKLKT